MKFLNYCLFTVTAGVSAVISMVINDTINTNIIPAKGSESSFAYMSETFPFNYSDIEDFILFGDSYTDVSVDYDSMICTGANLSGGKNWPQYLIRMHPMRMWNYAYSGSIVDFDIIGGYRLSPPMTQQYDYFLRNTAKGGKFSEWKESQTLFAIWFGINDINMKKIVRGRTSDEIFEDIATSMFRMVEGMYEKGGRHFLFLTVPPMEKFPAFAHEPDTYVKEDVPLYNEYLRRHAQDWQAQHPDTNVMVYQAYDEFNYLLDHTSTFGLTQTTEPYAAEVEKLSETSSSSLTLNSFFWADTFHPTPKVHKLLAQDLQDFMEQKSTPTTTTSPSPSSSMDDQDQDSMKINECWSLAQGYACCSPDNTVVHYQDAEGEWGIENNEWCGHPKKSTTPSSSSSSASSLCWAESYGYTCCPTHQCRRVYYEDEEDQWDIDDQTWCIITTANTLC